MNRRTFLRNTAVAATGLVIARFSHAQEVLSEQDGTAVAMGYAADASSVDVTVWTKKAAADGDQQNCTSCALYQGIDDSYGLCPIFAGKRVHANGWCNGWVPK